MSGAAGIPGVHAGEEVNSSIQTWNDAWNDDRGRFLWTKTADQILENITRYQGETWILDSPEGI